MTVQDEAVDASNPTWTFGDRIRKVRTSTMGMDQRGFAQLLGVTHGAIAQWESGKTVPRDIVATAKAVERLTGVAAGWLLGIDTPSTTPTGRSEYLAASAA